MARYRLTSPAYRDLHRITLAIAKHNLSAADRLVGEFTRTFELLQRNPRAGRVREELAPGLRGLRVVNWIVFYRLVASEQVVIVRVLEGWRDLPSVFDSDAEPEGQAPEDDEV